MKNGDLKQKSLVSAGIDSGRLGGRGVEGPGDGLKAGFWLETGLNADNGGQSDPTRFWNRRSTVSLMGNFGELSLGRDFTPTHTGIMDLHRGTASVISGAGRRTMFRLGFPGAGGADRARLESTRFARNRDQRTIVMNQQAAEKVEVTIEAIKESVPSTVAGASSVVIETEAVVDGRVRDASIEVRDADAPAVAAALLNADAAAPPAAADLPVAVQCMAAGVVHGASEGRVRLHLQFESGQVLPIEMPYDAAAALARTLAMHTGVR